MKKRIKEVRELIAEKDARLDSLNNTAEKEDRGWNETEMTEVRSIQEESKSLKAELVTLESEEKRKEERAKEEFAKKEEKETEEKRELETKVTGDNLKTKEARDAKTFSLIQGVFSNDGEKITEARKSLIEGGHLEKRNFSTLTDPKGGILVPKSIASDIWDIEQEYGFIPQHAFNFGNIGQSELIVPNVLSRPSFTAVNQGSAISGSGFNLGGLALKPLKWGAIIDWTNEVDESVGARLMPIIMRKIAEGLAFAKDDAFINGTGESAYNNIRGLEDLTGTVNYVRTATAPSGNVSFATLDADDFQLPVANVTPGSRAGGRYLMHPNMILTLQKLKDTQGAYIYGRPSEMAPVGSLFGYPVSVSEAFPITDGVTKSVCAFVNPARIAYANGRDLKAEQLTQATITNENGDSVNLATTDAQALKWTAIFDMKLDNNTRTTAAVAQGAFSVLRTAAS
jgi:HK97 family phage major capsid protein